MTSVLFVHGTGVRDPAYSQSYMQVKKALHDRRPDLLVLPCYWGGELGAQLAPDAKSIPEKQIYRSNRTVQEEDAEIALWAVLYQDPLYELRLLSFQTASEDWIPGSDSPGQIIDDRLQELPDSGELQARLDKYALSDVCIQAIKELTTESPYLEAISENRAGLSIYRAIIARSIVAYMIVLLEQLEHEADIVNDANLRDHVVDLLQQLLGAQERSVALWLGEKVFDFALALGVMNPIERRRRLITDAAYPFAGDILLYQARGEAIRAFIHERIIEAHDLNPPVVVIAHSLGGIACVDLCISTPLPELSLLVTVGSQAPFLYEIGALHSLRFNEELPEHVPPWLNIYDPRDFLSYRGTGVFLGKNEKVEDIRVDNRQPFPRSHSAYWANRATWDAIIPRIP